MKLLHKATTWYLLVSLLIFASGGIVLYYAIQSIVTEEIDERLNYERQETVRVLNALDSIPAQLNVMGDQILVKPVLTAAKEIVHDTILFDPAENELIPFRQLVFYPAVKGKIYEVRISKSLLESDDLIEAIAKALLITAIVLLIAIVLLNRFISRSLWSSFNNLLIALKQFRVQDKKALAPPPTDIREFDELADVVGQMTKRIVADYQNLRQFTENASHEMQTPLAIIRSKAELLMQSPVLEVSEMQKLRDIQDAVRKLSQVNRSLLLLAKIENEQFTETAAVDLKALTEKLLANYEDLIAEKRIAVKIALENVKRNMHPLLAEMLLNNLIHNAIRHNLPGGSIAIHLDQQTFVIVNSGIPLRVDNSVLFERFGKNDPSGDSIGLGLAIVKEICEKNSFTIAHQFKENEHIFSVTF